MKYCLSLLLLFSTYCNAQEWQAEFLAGFSGYNGDLTQKRINLEEYRPALNLNIKYHTGNFVDLRGGIVYGRVGADDKNNSDPGLKARNLNFKTNILEANIIAEINFLDPEVYTAYPYFFGGIGVFHFNPFTTDDNGKKVFLQPLSTEGEGLPEYLDRKKYSLTQICIPVGLGWQMPLNDMWKISFEFGYRFLFTDYLDDVSTTYPDLNLLSNEKGPQAAALSYRGTPTTTSVAGHQRGNPTKNDSYFIGGIKFTTSLDNLFGRSGY
jgi:hypothetical protein